MFNNKLLSVTRVLNKTVHRARRGSVNFYYIFYNVENKTFLSTRMHSSRMRIVRSLPYRGVPLYRRSLSIGGVSVQVGVSIQRVSVQGSLCPGGSLSGGGALSMGGLCPGGLIQGDLSPGQRLLLLPPNRLTDASKNITLLQTSFAGVNKIKGALRW